MSIAAAAAPARPNRSTANRRSYVDCDDGSDQSDSDAEPARAEGAPPKARQAAKSKGGRKRAASANERRNKSATSSKISRKSAGAAASAGVAEEANKATQFTIRWWDFVEPAGRGALRPNDPKHMDKIVAEANAKAGDGDALDAGQKILDAMTAIQRGEFARLPPAAIARWRNVEYGGATQYDDTPVAREQLMWWGHKDKILTRSKKLTKVAWDKVQEDLCESHDVRNRIPPNS